MFRKTLRAASAATGSHSSFSLASPPRGELSSLFHRNSRSLSAYAGRGHYVPSLPLVDSLGRVEKFFQKNCRAGDVSADEACRLFDRMVQMEPEVILYSFNLLLSGQAKNGRYRDVLSFYGKMNSAGLTMKLITHNILVDCFCDANRVREAFLVLGRLFRKGYSPTIMTFNSLIKGLCMGNRVYDAVQLFSKLEKFGCRPGEVTFYHLLCGLNRDDICDHDKERFWKEGNEDKAVKLSDIDTTIGDTNNCRPNSWPLPWITMLFGKLHAYSVDDDMKDQQELSWDIHNKNIDLDWKKLFDQIKLHEGTPCSQLSTQILK